MITNNNILFIVIAERSEAIFYLKNSLFVFNFRKFATKKNKKAWELSFLVDFFSVDFLSSSFNKKKNKKRRKKNDEWIDLNLDHNIFF